MSWNRPFALLARWGTIFAVTIFALAGCAKIDLDVTINPDNTLSGTYTIALEEGMLSDMEQYSSTPVFEDLESKPFPGITAVEDYDEEIDGDKYVGKRVIFADTPMDEFFAALNEEEDGTAGGEFVLTRDGDQFTFTADIANEDATEFPGFTEQIGKSFIYTITLTFPGTISETNGELSNEDRTVTWDIDLSGSNDLRAVGKAQAGVASWVWVLVGALVIAAVAILAFAFIIRSRNKKQAVLAAQYAANPVAAQYPQPGIYGQPDGSGAPPPASDAVVSEMNAPSAPSDTPPPVSPTIEAPVVEESSTGPSPWAAPQESNSESTRPEPPADQQDNKGAGS